jgi:hypothetical protein
VGHHTEVVCVTATKPNECGICHGYIAAGERVEFEAPKAVRHVKCALAERRRGNVLPEEASTS